MYAVKGWGLSRDMESPHASNPTFLFVELAVAFLQLAPFGTDCVLEMKAGRSPSSMELWIIG